MSMVQAIDLARGALFMVMYIAGPILLFGVAVGLMIALFQAVTSLQEQTLQFVPKIFAMALATGILIPVLAAKLLDYASVLIGEPPL
jgi:flagellar biosynthetic protein FliQ